MELALDIRIQHFAERYLGEVENSHSPELDEMGNVALISIVNDAGYDKKLGNNVYARVNPDDTTDVFIGPDKVECQPVNPINLKPGLAYVKFGGLEKATEFAERYRTEADDGTTSTGTDVAKDTMMGIIGGAVIGVATNLVLYFGTGQNNPELGMVGMIGLPFGFGVFGAVTMNDEASKTKIKEDRHQEFLTDYSNIVVGKRAILEALKPYQTQTE